jgi:glycosyltransferase involved in cell wall biosynthesis
MKALVSILIPAYNAEKWIADTIKSALDQTWSNKEIVIVDDGSRDQTLLVARQFASRTVSVVSQENQGASAARNKAISLCQGDYIQWLDADDLLAPDKISQQMKAVEQCQSKKTLFSSAWAYFMHRLSKAKFIPTPLWQDLSPSEWLIRKMGQNLHMQTATWLVSRELLQSAGPWDVRLWKDNDGEYFCRVILASDGIRFIPEARTFYRRSACNSVTNIGRSNRKLESQFLSMRLHVQYLLSLDDSESARAACLSYLQTRFIHFYPQRMDIVTDLQALALGLGGKLETPRLAWKFAWIQKILGWKLAKETQLVAREFKENMVRSWDRVLLEWDRCRGWRSKIGEQGVKRSMARSGLHHPFNARD